MADSITKIFERISALKSARQPYETEWQEHVDTYMPGTQAFTTSSKPWKPVSAIAAEGKDVAQTFVAQLYSGLFSNKWFDLVPNDPNVELSAADTAMLEKMSKITLDIFAGSESNFAGQIHESLMSMVVLGSSSIFIDNSFGTDISFHTLPLSQIYYAENYKHKIDTIVRIFKFTAKQAVQAWGDSVHEEVLKAYDKSPEKMFEFAHCSWENSSSKSSNDKYVSYYVDIENKHIMKVVYKPYLNFVSSRWSKFSGELYGHGQAKLAQSTMRGITHLRLEMLKSAEFANNPVIMYADDGVMIPDVLRPGTGIPGAISSLDGQRRLEPWSPSGNNQVVLQQLEREIATLKSLFFLDKISLPRDATRRTAFETSAIQQEQVRFLAPHINRIETELLKPLVETVFKMLLENGVFDEMSDTIKGLDLKVDFLSPLARLLKMENVRSEQQFLNTILPLLQFDQSQVMKINFEKIIEDAQKGTGAPAHILRDKDEVEAMKAQQAQQQQQASQTQNALAASQIAKNLGGINE